MQKGLGSLYKRGADGRQYPPNSHVKGNFWLEYWEGGKRHRKPLTVDGEPVTSLKVARREQMRLRAPYLAQKRLGELREVEREIKEAEGLVWQMERPALRLADAWKTYIQSPRRRENGEGTRKCYETYWNRFLSWMAVHSPNAGLVADVTADDAARFLREVWGGGGITANTWNKYLVFLRSIFTALKADPNPFADLEKRRLERNGRRVLTREELRKVEDKADGALRLLLVLGATTGLRLGDCCTLRWREVDLDKGIIRRVARKTAHSSGAEVAVGICEELRRELAAIPERERGEYVLPVYREMYERDRSSVVKVVQRHFEGCGIQTREDTGRKRKTVQVGFHSLRHTWVTMQTEAGMPLQVVQKVAGHSNPAMTEHYTHITDELARRMARNLDEGRGSGEVERKREILRRAVEGAGEETLDKLIEAIKEV